MKRLLLSALLAALLIEPASAAPMHGVAARYSSERLMRRAAEIHGVTVPRGYEVCASPIERLGTRLTITSRVRGRAGAVWRCVVGDIAHPRDRATILRRGIIAELTPRGALHLCGTVRDRPEQCKVTVERNR